MGIYNEFFILFAVIAVGFIAKKRHIISNNMNQDLGNFILYISLPALIYASTIDFVISKESMKEVMTLIIISISTVLFFITISILYTKMLRIIGTKRDLIQLMAIFANTAFMGFPIALIFFGEKGLFYAVLVHTFFDMFVWTYGMLLLQKSKRQENKDKITVASLLKQLTNPCIVAMVVGFITIGLSTNVPNTFIKFLNMLGSVSAPLSMIFIGSMIADLEIKKVFSEPTLFAGSALKLLLIPFILMGILRGLGFEGLMVGIPVLLSGMPAAAITPILAEKYESNSYYASQMVLISTLLSVVTIPFILHFIII